MSVILRLAHLISWVMIGGVGLAVGLAQHSNEDSLILSAGTDALQIDFPSGIVRQIENPFVTRYNPSADRVIQTPDDQNQFRVVYSPAGNNVSNVYSLYHEPGGADPLLIDSNVTRNFQWFASDSRYLYYYAQRRTRQLWRYDIAAQVAERVLGNVQMDCRGDDCAVLQTRDGPPGDTLSDYFLYHMSLRDGQPQPIDAARATDQGIPYAWSRQADQLVYTLPTGDGGHTLHVYTLAMGEAAQVAQLPPVERIRRLDWKPDGTWVAVTTTTRENRIDVFAASTNPAAPQIINFTGGVPGDTYQVNPFWSDDVPLLAFLYQDNLERNLYTGSMTDGSLRQVTDFTGAAHMHAWWSPGSRWLAVAVQVQNFPAYDCELVILHRATGRVAYRMDFSNDSGICERSFGVRWQ